MIMYRFILLITLIVFAVFSCSSKKDIILAQNIKQSDLNNISFREYKLKIDDVLKIDILTESDQINLGELNTPTSKNSNTRESLIFDGYQIDSDGMIDIPSIGKIFVMGLSISKLEDTIKYDLIDKGILNKPTVDIKLLNGHFTVLGEVNSPGRYNFLNNNMDILQAIGMAGDLTINAVRTDVKLLRYTDNNEKIISSIDLTKPDFMNEDGFQIFSGDIILVNPNNRRVKQAGFIENPTVFSSLLSVLITTIVFLTR